jgi:hypothetical protein
MRLRTSPFVLAIVACTATGSMALTSTTAFASSHHGGSSKVTVKGNGNCTVVGNNNSVHCTSVSHSHRHGGGGGGGDFGGRHRGDPGLGHGLEDVVSGVGDILGGLLGGL